MSDCDSDTSRFSLVLFVSLYFLKGIVIVFGIPSEAYNPSNKHANTLKRTRYSVINISTFISQSQNRRRLTIFAKIILIQKAFTSTNTLDYKEYLSIFRVKLSLPTIEWTRIKNYIIYIFQLKKYSERRHTFCLFTFQFSGLRGVSGLI